MVICLNEYTVFEYILSKIIMLKYHIGKMSLLTQHRAWAEFHTACCAPFVQRLPGMASTSAGALVSDW